MISETIQLTGDPHVTLTTYLHEPSEAMPNNAVRRAVMICPGGGYLFCSDREGEPIALAFMSAGYQAFVLRYSVGEHAAFPRPLKDAEIALNMIRTRAEEWGVDPCQDCCLRLFSGWAPGGGVGDHGPGTAKCHDFGLPVHFGKHVGYLAGADSLTRAGSHQPDPANLHLGNCSR